MEIENVKLAPNLSRTPEVRVAEMRTACNVARLVSPDRPEALAAAIESRWGSNDNSTALWARTRALLVWQGLEGTKESDRLWIQRMRLEKELGVDIDPLLEIELDAFARIGAASKHPLDAAGRFVAGFREAIQQCKAAMLSSEGQTKN